MELQDLIAHHHPVRSGRDIVQWGTKESFSVKDLLSKANSLSKVEADIDNLVCTVWRNIAPPKVEFMLWLALLEKLSTKDLLVKKGVLLSQANVCSFCTQHQEDIDHLLLNCQCLWSIWCIIAEDFGVQLIEQQRQQRFRQFYEWWMSKRFHNRNHKKLFILAFFAVAWSLWTKRNKVVFEQQELGIHTLELKIKWRIVWWTKAWKETSSYNTEKLFGNFRAIPMMLL